ncbi:outer membrane lipoprotein carrier protein LolA [Hydrogenimonas sp.]|nr:outer membrane lipoprotein carrier protein LolA [Hydrogenimonas sp.]
MKIIIVTALAAKLLMASLPVPDYFSADFTQVVQNRETKKQLYYSGRLFMKMPSDAKWDYFIPLKKTICLIDHKAWVIEPELEQATLFRLKKSIPLMEILKNAKKRKNGDYEAEFGGTKYLIATDPQNSVKSISYLDEMGNRVTLRFQNVKTEPFDSSKLECEIPDDYDIIDGRY